LAITDALLSAHCVPASPQNNTLSFQLDAISRTLTIQGFNFLNGATPLVTLGNVGLPLTLATPPTATTITVNFDCSQFSTGTYRLHVSTGSGTPYNGDFYFSFSTQGPAGLAGAKGDPGVAGPQGPNGLSGNDGKDGAPGQSGANGKDGVPGQNGKGHRVVITKLLPGSACPSGGNQQDFYTIAADGTSTLFDTEIICHGNNGQQSPQGNQGSNGRDGAPGLNGFNGPQGPQGPAGVANGWYEKFDTSAITSTCGNVLTQTVTGTPAYLVDAKVNSPFANNAKSVACSLTALDNGVTTVIDTSDALLIGNTQTTAKGGISLAGVYTASSSSASVTISVSCSTGGDTRTLTNGRMNIVGANSVN